MKKALVVFLVVVVLVTGMPIVVGMTGMASCRDCGPALMAGAACAVAVLGAGVTLLALFAQRFRSRAYAVRLLLRTFLLERPPRPA